MGETDAPRDSNRNKHFVKWIGEDVEPTTTRMRSQNDIKRVLGNVHEKIIPDLLFTKRACALSAVISGDIIMIRTPKE